MKTTYTILVLVILLCILKVAYPEAAPNKPIAETGFVRFSWNGDSPSYLLDVNDDSSESIILARTNQNYVDISDCWLGSNLQYSVSDDNGVIKTSNGEVVSLNNLPTPRNISDEDAKERFSDKCQRDDVPNNGTEKNDPDKEGYLGEKVEDGKPKIDGDMDGDGWTDSCDPDKDGDGICDEEGNPLNALDSCSTDSDGNYDNDDDNDGIADEDDPDDNNDGINDGDTAAERCKGFNRTSECYLICSKNVDDKIDWCEDYKKILYNTLYDYGLNSSVYLKTVGFENYYINALNDNGVCGEVWYIIRGGITTQNREICHDETQTEIGSGDCNGTKEICTVFGTEIDEGESQGIETQDPYSSNTMITSDGLACDDGKSRGLCNGGECITCSDEAASASCQTDDGRLDTDCDGIADQDDDDDDNDGVPDSEDIDSNGNCIPDKPLTNEGESYPDDEYQDEEEEKDDEGCSEDNECKEDECAGDKLLEYYCDFKPECNNDSLRQRPAECDNKECIKNEKDCKEDYKDKEMMGGTCYEDPLTCEAECVQCTNNAHCEEGFFCDTEKQVCMAGRTYNKIRFTRYYVPDVKEIIPPLPWSPEEVDDKKDDIPKLDMRCKKTTNSKAAYSFDLTWCNWNAVFWGEDDKPMVLSRLFISKYWNETLRRYAMLVKDNDEWDDLNPDGSPIIIGSHGRKLVVEHSVAADPNWLSGGTKIHVKFRKCLDKDCNEVTECSDPECCKRWSLDYVVDDGGSALEGTHTIDLYTGIGEYGEWSSYEDASCIQEEGVYAEVVIDDDIGGELLT